MAPPTIADALAARYYQSVHRFVRRSVVSADVADDLTQEVFLRIARAVPTYDPCGDDQAWVFTIARRVLASHATSGQRAVPTVSLEEAAPCAVAPTQLFYASLREALDALPNDAREILLLRDHHGLSYQGIAAAVGTTHATIRSRLARVRRRLARAVVWATGPSAGTRKRRE